MVDPFVTAPLNVTVACPSPLVALIVVGADALPCVVNAVELVPAVEFPTALTATTANVYATPSVSPVHV
jgi:hypothetical protein